MEVLRKMHALLTPGERRDSAKLLVLMVVGMVVDTLGISLVIPGIALLIGADLAKEHPQLLPLLQALGNPTRTELIVGGLVVLVVAYLLRTAFLAFLAWRQSGFAYGVQAQLSQRLLTNYLGQPYTFHLQRNSAQLIRNATREVEFFTLYCLINALLIGTDGLVIFGIAALLLVIEPIGAIAAAVVMVLAAWLFSLATRKRLARWGLGRQHHEGVRLQRLQEALGGAKDVMLLGREEEFLKRYAIHNSASAELAQRQATVAQLPRLWIELLAVLALAILILTMLAQGRELTTLVPTLGLFAVAGFRLMPSVNRVLTAVQGFRYGRPTIDILHGELKLAVPDSRPKRGAPNAFRRELRLSGVGYTYAAGAVPALEDASIAITPGEAVGIVGPSGAGKSTLVDVCLGLLTPTVGTVTLDGVDIRHNLRAWQDQIGYVPQSIYLTDDTLQRNIAFGLPDEEIDEPAVRRAIRDAQLEEFVTSLPNGLNSVVGERGTALSGGQRQRVGIARALYHDPAVLVLDEATSALDSGTESGVLRAVSALHGRKTVLIVAHRFSTVAGCDRILRLQQGRVIHEGRPEAMPGEIHEAGAALVGNPESLPRIAN
jgi:ABC-type multidrug transport system fused ATPase/permease subunit